ncbi:hypothetical protein [Rathayibacter sp. VKM Ac-2805]|uniref:hypothetical protein n=1 Tax=Rathayibacter sp. VKM Ac-2805 TaxID=2609258 RepID=UPI00131FC3F6|nr:hypothetical protein [Rathayibacter sp. VKM Ac-2805]QHC73367.1 hypothetical protein GSU40_06530 [Rathayibacter sp. VKM Ac-2805]
MNPHSPRVEVLSSAAALTLSQVLMRLRELRILLFNPLALVAAVVAAGGYIWVLVTQGDHLADDPSTAQPYVAGFVFGLCLIIVSLTAQRGSPLRLQPGDVSWALQSRHGPRVVLLVHGVGASLSAFIGATVSAAVALALRGEPPALGPISGFAVLSVLLALRAASLGSHLLGQSRFKGARLAGVSTLVAASLVWVGSFVARFVGVGEDVWLVDVVTETGASPFRAVIEPEHSGLGVSGAVLVLAAAVLTICFGRANAFVEPAVHESILANQLQKVLSGGQTSSLQGRGYKAGLSSWTRWPDDPLHTLLCSHLAQARRRRTQYIGTILMMNVIVLVPILLRDFVPAGTGLLIALLVLTISSPSQLAATELDHQHLLLADVSLIRAGLVGVCLNALLDLLVCAPALVIGVSIVLGSPLWGLAFLLPLVLYLLSSSFGGVGARALSDATLGRAFVSLLLGAIPLLTAVSAVAAYGDDHLALRLWLTTTGTLLVSTLLYAGMAIAVFVTARPQGTHEDLHTHDPELVHR